MRSSFFFYDFPVSYQRRKTRFGGERLLSGARFSEGPVTFRARNQIIPVEIKRVRAPVLAKKLLHFVSLTDSFIMLDAKLLKPRSLK